MAGAQRRSVLVPLSPMPMTAAMVTKALTGPAAAGSSGDAWCNMRKRIGITVTGRSMITVPVTVGVRTRRSSESRVESAIWTSDETTTRVASIAGPPSARAVTQTAMKVLDVPVRTT